MWRGFTRNRPVDERLLTHLYVEPTSNAGKEQNCLAKSKPFPWLPLGYVRFDGSGHKLRYDARLGPDFRSLIDNAIPSRRMDFLWFVSSSDRTFALRADQRLCAKPSSENATLGADALCPNRWPRFTWEYRADRGT